MWPVLFLTACWTWCTVVRREGVSLLDAFPRRRFGVVAWISATSLTAVPTVDADVSEACRDCLAAFRGVALTLLAFL